MILQALPAPSGLSNLSNPASIICVEINVNDYLPTVNPLKAKLNPIRHLLALLGAHHILHVSRVRVKGPVIWVLRNTMQLRIKASRYVEWYKRH